MYNNRQINSYTLNIEEDENISILDLVRSFKEKQNMREIHFD